MALKEKKNLLPRTRLTSARSPFKLALLPLNCGGGAFFCLPEAPSHNSRSRRSESTCRILDAAAPKHRAGTAVNTKDETGKSSVCEGLLEGRTLSGYRFNFILGGRS